MEMPPGPTCQRESSRVYARQASQGSSALNAGVFAHGASSPRGAATRETVLTTWVHTEVVERSRGLRGMKCGPHLSYQRLAAWMDSPGGPKGKFEAQVSPLLFFFYFFLFFFIYNSFEFKF